MSPRTTRIRTSYLVATLLTIAAIVGLAHLAGQRISTDGLRARVEKDLGQVLGLTVTIDALHIVLLPTPHLDAEGIRMSSPPGSDAPLLLNVDRVGVGIALWPLLEKVVRIDALEIAGAELHLEAGDRGALNERFDLTSLVDDESDDGVDLEIRQLLIEDLRAFYRNPSREIARSLVVDSLRIESNHLHSKVELEAKGEYEGGEVALSGQVGSLLELIQPTGSFPVSLEGRLFESHFTARGTVAHPLKLADLDLDVSAAVPKLVVEGHPLPELGAIRLEGRLSNSDGPLGIEDLHVQAGSSDPVNLQIRGKVRDLIALKGVDVEARIETGSLDFLAPLVPSGTDFPLPRIASLSGKATLTDQKEGLVLEGKVKASMPGNTIILQTEGTVRGLRDVPRIDAQVDLRAPDLASLKALAPELPIRGSFGPVTGKARLQSEGRKLGASQIEIRVGTREKIWVEADGRIADVLALRDVDLELEFGAESLHHLQELIEGSLPETTPIAGSAALHDRKGPLSLENLSIHGGQESPFEIHVEARFEDLRNRDGLEIDLGLRSADLETLGALAQIELPTVGPIDLRGKLRHANQKFEIEGMSLQLGETRLAGNASGSIGETGYPMIKARVTSERVRLQDLGWVQADPTQAPSSETPPVSFPNTSDDDSTLPFDALRRADLDLDLELKRITGHQGLDVQDLRAKIDLRSGNLLVPELSAHYEEGALRAQMQVDARAPQPDLKLDFQGDHLKFARVMSQFQKDTDYSGIIDADFSLRASGDTLRKLRSALDGRVSLSIHEGNLASKIGRKFVVNLVSTAFLGLKAEKVPNVACGVADLELENGVAQVHTLFLKGKEVGIVGAGEIDLVQGEYDLHIVPKTMKRSIVSIAPEVLVTGPLDDPEFTSVKRTLFTSFGHGLLSGALRAGSHLFYPFRQHSRTTEIGLAECRAEAAKARAAVSNAASTSPSGSRTPSDP